MKAPVRKNSGPRTQERAKGRTFELHRQHPLLFCSQTHLKHHILGFHIAVHDPLGVQEAKRLQQLAEDAPHARGVPRVECTEGLGPQRLDPRAEAAKRVERKDEEATAALLKVAGQPSNERVLPLVRVLLRSKKVMSGG
jgi:hypothetical protein